MSDPAQFWSWFLANQERLYGLLGSSLTDELYDELIKYDDRLGIEVCTDEPVRDVIVTAFDCQDAFDSVRQLIRAAPSLERWTFVALRPGKGFDFSTTDGKTTLDASTLMFDPTEAKSRPTELGLIVYVPGTLAVDRELELAVIRAISTGIGEELSSIIKYFKICPGLGPEGNLPVKDLRRYIEWHLKRMG